MTEPELPSPAVCASRFPAGSPILEESGEGAALIDQAGKGATWVMLVDAVRSGAPPGTIHRLDARAAPIPDRVLPLLHSCVQRGRSHRTGPLFGPTAAASDRLRHRRRELCRRRWAVSCSRAGCGSWPSSVRRLMCALLCRVDYMECEVRQRPIACGCGVTAEALSVSGMIRVAFLLFAVPDSHAPKREPGRGSNYHVRPGRLSTSPMRSPASSTSSAISASG